MNARWWLVVLAVCAVGAAALHHRSAAQQGQARPADEKPAVGQGEQPKDGPVEAAVRKTADEFTAAFNKGDAKAVAAFWTKEGEFVGADGEPIRGREAIEKAYAEFFKDNPKASVETKIDSVRVIGRQAVLEEGRLTVRLPGKGTTSESRYTVMHVREEEAWKMASVREWELSPAELVTLKDVEWLIGDWEAKSENGELRVSYAWDEDRAFIRGRYVMKKGDKATSSGTQVIGKDPAAGLRSWVFDASGSFAESNWARDGERWVIDAGGTLPDGSEAEATNILIPLGKDAFTWQSVDRSIGGSALPDLPPVKVTRVKK